MAGAVSATSATSITLSPLGQGRLNFATTAPATGNGCHASGPAPAPQSGSATITVTRPGTDKLKSVVTNMVSNGFGVAGSIVSPVLSQCAGQAHRSQWHRLCNRHLPGPQHQPLQHDRHFPHDYHHPVDQGAGVPGRRHGRIRAGLSFSLEGTTLDKIPGLIACIYVPPDNELIECPQGDGSFVNGAAGGCQIVEIVESTGQSAQGLNAGTFCSNEGCESQGPLPGSAVDGDAAYEATGPKETDPKAILVEGVKDGFEVNVGVGWEADIARSEALIKALFAQHFGK